MIPAIFWFLATERFDNVCLRARIGEMQVIEEQVKNLMRQICHMRLVPLLLFHVLEVRFVILMDLVMPVTIFC